jgi:hypothetical protein
MSRTTLWLFSSATVSLAAIILAGGKVNNSLRLLRAEQRRNHRLATLAIKTTLSELDEALESLEIWGRHSDQGYRKLKDWYRKMGLATKAIDADRESKCGWVAVTDRLPEGTVLAYYTNSHGKGRRIRARYVKRFTQESEDIDNFDAQYNEDDDTYYDAEGWYELIDNWGDYSSVAVVEGEITHWRELPPPPKESK